jgi:transposase-like protein
MKNNIDFEKVGSAVGSSRRHFSWFRELKVDALSAEEKAYLLGLYFADGCADAGRRSGGGRRWRVRFFLQGNEKELADRAVELLSKLGLRPRFDKPRKGEWMLTVRVLSKALFNFLPDKQLLVDDTVVRDKFLAENGLSGVEEGIPFLAGLLDGDGFCQVSVEKKVHRAGAVNFWKWGIGQDRCMFLLDYVKRFVQLLTKDERSVSVEVARTGRHRVCIRKAGVVALLNSGIGEYSWKASRWLRQVAEIQGERMNYLTTGQVAAVFGVCREYVRSQLEAGKLRFVRGTGKARETGVSASKFGFRYFIPVEEAKRFGEKLREDREKSDNVKREGVTLKDLAKLLGVPWNTLRRWRRRGLIQGTVLREMGKGHRRRFLVIPWDEVERLKRKLSESDNRWESHQDAGWRTQHGTHSC